MNIIARTLAALAAALTALAAAAQSNVIHDSAIASLQVTAGDDWLSPPVVRLGGGSPADRVNVSFDDLTHAYRRLTYTIEHCEADWKPSEGVFASDFIEGFASGNTIDESAESVNTNTLYTHYSLTIPNDRCRLKMSGNYRLRVFDENDDMRPVLTACFMVTETAASLSLTVSSNTDIDVNRSHQQVSVRASYGSLPVDDPASQIKLTVMQNGRADNAVANPRPQSITPKGVTWEHCRELIFDAGNEYRKFETLSLDHPTMGVDSIKWDGGRYHAYITADAPRPNYVYDEDANGSFCIRNSDDSENDIASDYATAHFRLDLEQPVNGRVYINGAWTNGLTAPPYELQYDPSERCYRAAVTLKQGYYSYQYVMRGYDGQTRPLPSEGSFSQTENKYQALLYFRGRGERADRLAAYTQAQFK